jgi:hypothetical protein
MNACRGKAEGKAETSIRSSITGDTARPEIDRAKLHGSLICLDAAQLGAGDKRGAPSAQAALRGRLHRHEVDVLLNVAHENHHGARAAEQLFEGASMGFQRRRKSRLRVEERLWPKLFLLLPEK